MVSYANDIFGYPVEINFNWSSPSKLDGRSSNLDGRPPTPLQYICESSLNANLITLGIIRCIAYNAI